MGSDPRRRWRVRVGLLLFVLAAASCGGVGAAFYAVRSATDYPGARLVADQTQTRYAGNFSIRRTAAYRTADPFNKVYNWYSSRFELGPEMYAQSSCILMSKSTTLGLGFDEQMSVMVCNTPNDQLMFVTRTLIYRYPHPG